MAQQRHSSEIVLSIDDQQVHQSINRLSQSVQTLQQNVQRGITGAVTGVSSQIPTAPLPPAPPTMPPPAPTISGGGGAGPTQGAGVLSGLARSVPIVGGVVSPLIAAARRRGGQAQNLEGLIAELQMGGGVAATGNVRQIGALLGYGPEQALGIAQSFSRMTQMRRDVSEAEIGNLMLAERLGIGAQAIGGFAGGGALGGGATGGVGQEMQTALQLAGYARQTLQLSGTGTARFLASIAQATQRMATKGMSIDTRSIGAFVQGVDEAARRQGLRAVRGEGAVRATQVVMGMGEGALGGFKGQFGQIGQGLLQAAAAKGTSSPLGMIKKLEEFATEPEVLMKALIDMGVSSELIQLALLGSGASTAQVRSIMAAPTRVSPLKGGALITEGERAKLAATTEEGLPAGMLALSRQQAMTDNTILTQVEQNKEVTVALIRLSQTFETLALDMTKRDAVLTSVLTTLEETVRELPDTISSLKETLSDLPSAIYRAVIGD